MDKKTFLAELKAGLSGLPQKDIDERLSFYGEMIDDRMEEGMSEEEAVAGLDPIDIIVAQTVADIPFAKLIKERIKPKRALRGWEIALIILGFPLWFPLLIAAGAVILSIYIVVWSLAISLWAIDVSFGACALGGIGIALIDFVQGRAMTGFAMIGAALLCAGLAFLLFYGCIEISKWSYRLAQKALFGAKKLFLKEEEAK